MTIVAAGDAPYDVLINGVAAAACLVFSVPLAARLIRRRPLDLPERLPRGRSVFPLVVALAWAMFVWAAVPSVYRAWSGTPGTRPASAPAREPSGPTNAPPIPAPPAPTVNLADLPPRDVAFLSTVPHLVAFLAMLALDLAVFGGDLTPLGFSAGQARRGLATGIALALVFIPLVFAAAIVTEFVYRAAGYSHPSEHELLRVLGNASEPIVRVVLVLGATVVAPVAEELLFRGHAQTIMRRALARVARPRRVARGFPLDNQPTDASEGFAQDSNVPPAWATWGAIVLASALFAGVHAPWTWPPIFLLSLCLGWAYEQSGNLWVPVAVHAAFNMISTIIFLTLGGGA